MLKYVLGGVAVLLAAAVGLVAMQPDTYVVSRSATVHASPEVVYDQLDDFPTWLSWSPWSDLDPDQTVTYEGPEQGVGAAYTWEGNEDVGKGRMEVLEAEPGQKVVWDLEFIEPFASTAVTRIDLAAADDGATEVTWTMTGDNDFMGKLMGLLMDMDAMIGKDFERGLSRLDGVAKAAQDEADAAAAAAAEAAALAEAEAAAAAEAALGDEVAAE